MAINKKKVGQIMPPRNLGLGTAGYFFLFCLAAWLFSSCAARSSQRFEKLSKYATKKNYLSAVKTIRKNTKLYGKTNSFLYHMDLGLLFHYAGLYDSSNIQLEKAVKVNDALFQRSLTKEAASILTNDNVRPYRGKPYEIVLVHQFLALNYLALGKTDEALVETRRAQLLFDEWERKDKKGVKYSTDGMFHYLSSIAFDAQGERDNSLISLFKAVEAFRQGAVPLPEQIKNYAYYKLVSNDRSADTELLKIKPTLPRDKVGNLENRATEIVVVGEAGRGPVLVESSWWGTWVKDGLLIVHFNHPDGRKETITMPAPGLPEKEYRKASEGKKTRSGTTFHIKFAMPRVKTFQSQTKYFTVNHNSLPAPGKTIVINNFDKQASKALEDSRKSVLIRTVIRVVLRTMAAEQTKGQLSGSHPLANLLVNVGTDVLTDQLEKADTRNCFLVPETIQIARIPVKPGTHKVEVIARNASGAAVESRVFENVSVRNGEKKFLFFSLLK